MSDTARELVREHHATRRPRQTHPDGMGAPGVTWNGNRGEAVVAVPAGQDPDWDDLLREFGMGDVVHLLDVTQVRLWNGYDGRVLKYLRANVVRRASADQVDVDALITQVMRYKPRKIAAPKLADEALVVCLADWQTGKRDGDGLAGLQLRLERLHDLVTDRLKRLRPQRLLVAGLGDIVEGCLAGETRVVTKHGVFTIAELTARGSAIVKSTYGKWVEAEFRSYGRQRLFRIDLSRGRAMRTVYATGEHRWFALENPSANSGKVEVLTTGLEPGQMLVANFGKHPQIVSPIGVMAGYVFGDGHRQSRDRQHGCGVYVYRDDWCMLEYFKGHPQSDPRKHHENGPLAVTENGDSVKVGGLPAFMNDLPSLDESLPYLFGWAAGYFAADGCVSKGVCSLSSANRENLEHFAAVCARIGIGTNPIRESMRKGCGREPSALYSISLVRQTIPERFMVHDGKRAKFLASGPKTSSGYTFQRNRCRHWRVESVEITDRFEEVYCATVPGTQAFTLDHDLLTGNCDGFYPMQTYSVELDRRRQCRFARRWLVRLLTTWARYVPEVVVVPVAGNHGEHRRDGKAFTDWGDNDDIAVFEQAAEVLAASDAYQHVRFLIPEDGITATVDVFGHVIGFTHGHVARGGSGIRGKITNWWKGKQHALHPIGDCRTLVTGHYHHLVVVEDGPRTWLQCPPLDGGSDWFEAQGGPPSNPGTLTFTAGANGWGRLEVLR